MPAKKSPMSLEKILDASSRIGYLMLSYGAEISRVEDTARRICMAYGADEAHVFAISSSIVITLVRSGETLTQTRRVTAITTNLDRVDRLNHLSRMICETLPEYDEIMASVNEIERRPLYSSVVSVFAYALISGAFAIFFSGSVWDMLSATVIGASIRLVMLLLEYLKAAPFFLTAAAASVATGLARLFSTGFGAVMLEPTLLGVLMNLVPGVALTNSMRDFIATDYMSGVGRLVECFFTGAAIALGAAFVLFWR
ncbi:MAG: threonine/serine exporter family protein [Clostridia bacterium]|nr:threonine/serine exporter family protein [Clostridia bacterium]